MAFFPPQGILRYSRRDARLITLAAAYGVALVTIPSALLIAFGVWWGSNTIAHYFLHAPFFVDRRANRRFRFFLSAVLGIPQTLWRDRHLAHHAGRAPRLRLSRDLKIEIALVGVVWAAWLVVSPATFLSAYVPGYLIGLGLCSLHGHFEHRPEAVSYYGRLYNLIFFNDGYHAEHHAHPGLHWTRLPRVARRARYFSQLPSPLRWLDPAFARRA